MMEALACHPLGQFSQTLSAGTSLTRVQTRSKFECSFQGEQEHQGYQKHAIAHPIAPVDRCTGKTAQLLEYRQRHRQARNTSRSIQRSRRRLDRDCTENGNSLHVL